MIRKLLRLVLTSLSRWAITKHEMKIIVVAGSHGTKLTGEMLGDMLPPEYIVRKQLEAPFWDFSVPLAILGEEDKRYSLFGWLKLIARAAGILAFGPKNFTWTILQMNTFNKEIAGYWINILEPEVVLLVNTDRELRYLERMLALKAKEIVVLSDDTAGLDDLQKGKATFYLVGRSDTSDVQITSLEEKPKGIALTARFKRRKGEIKELELFALQKGEFMKEPIMTSVAALFALGIEPANIKEKLVRAEINIERFIHTIS